MSRKYISIYKVYPGQIQNKIDYCLEKIESFKSYKLAKIKKRGTMRFRILQHLFICIILLAFAESWVSFFLFRGAWLGKFRLFESLLG